MSAEFISIKRKLTFLIQSFVSSIFVFVLIVVISLNIRSVQSTLELSENYIKSSLHTRGITLIENNRLALRGLINDYAISDIKSLVSNTVKNDKDILYGLFMTEDLKPIAYTQVSNYPQNLIVKEFLDDSASLWASRLTNTDVLHYDLDTNEILEFAAPVFVADELRGHIRYGFSTKSMKDAIQNTYQSAIRERNIVIVLLLALSLFSMLLSFLISTKTAHRITHPLRTLLESAKKLAEGDYEYEFSLESNDEIGDLADNFVAMRDAIRKKINELNAANLRLEEHKVGLEKEVLERTKDYLDAKEKAEAANRSKTEFLSNMSHDIRTPMNAVLGFTEILYSQEEDYSKKHYLDNILSSGKSLLSLINDILDVSKVEAGKLELQFCPISIQALFDEIALIFEKKLNDKELTFHLSLPDDFPELVVMDDTRLRQIFINLIGNSIKFTESGEISLVGRYERQLDSNSLDCYFTVKDSGKGIERDQFERIFNAFEQHEGQKTSSYGGTGLGLYITKKLIEMMNGTIDVESEPGQGSSFNIVFRDVEFVHVETKKIASHPEKTSNSIDFERASILVVDDLEFNRELCIKFLSQFKFRFTEAVNGQDALDKLEEETFDLILMDIRMPVMDGKTAVMKIKENARTKDIPVIAITASALKDEVNMIRSICDGYLRKPLLLDELLTEIMKFIPYEMKEDNRIENSISETVEFSSTIFSDNQKLYNELIPLSATMKSYLSSMNMTGIEELSSTVKELAEKHNNKELILWSEKLFSAVTLFEVDIVDAELKKFLSLFDTGV